MVLRIFSILIISATTNYYIPAAPSIVGALVDYQGVSNDVAGRLISYNFWGATIGTVPAIFILHRPGWNLRLTIFGCLLLVIASSGAAGWLAGNVEAFGVVGFVNGLGAGLGFTVTAVALIGTPHVERSYAILYGLPFLISGASLPLLPYVYQAVGVEGAFYGFGTINILACGLLPFFPKTVTHKKRKSERSDLPVDRQTIFLASILLAALFLHYVSNSGIWAYFERIGVSYGMSPERAGAILGPSMSAAIIGMVTAAIVGDRLGYLRPIYIGTFIIILSTLSLLFSSSTVVFGIGTGIFNASITFVTPYFIAILASLVPSGLGVTTANITIMAGFATGPLVVSFFITNDDFRPSILLTAAGFAVVCGLVFCFSRVLQNVSVGEERL